VALPAQWTFPSANRLLQNRCHMSNNNLTSRLLHKRQWLEWNLAVTEGTVAHTLLALLASRDITKTIYARSRLLNRGKLSPRPRPEDIIPACNQQSTTAVTFLMHPINGSSLHSV